MKIVYYIVFFSWYLLSLLPLKLLYLFSDLLYFPLYYCIGYRQAIVRKNLVESFPDKDIKEIVRIEKQFYRFFCDYMVETVKLFSMSKKQIKRRMTFSGTDEIAKRLEKEGKNFCFVYLGHYGNWEWIASLPYWMPESVLCGQIYHPLKNKAFDKLFLYLRNQFGGECIPMKETLRRIIELKRAKQKTVIGFISDQAPKWNSIHHWAEFLHHDTPVFTGTERIGKQVDALIYYADVKRVKRGYYHCEFKQLADNAKAVPDYGLTDMYIRNLEQMITAAPSFWLWSHNRWKRTREEWIRRQKEEQKEK
ncbi:lysophospholipid acyltransferase family protein [Phocaeicola sp.]